MAGVALIGFQVLQALKSGDQHGAVVSLAAAVDPHLLGLDLGDHAEEGAQAVQEVGVNCAPGNYDAVLISAFDSLEDLEAYKRDPRHAAVSALCKSIRSDRVAVDVEV